MIFGCSHDEIGGERKVFSLINAWEHRGDLEKA